MKISLSAPVISRDNLRSICSWLATATLLCAATNLTAQSVLVGSPKTTLTPRIIQNDSAPDPSSSNVIAGPETATTYELGQIKLRPQLQLRYMQANGLPTGVGANKDTSISTFAPGVTLELGSSWILNYTPTWVKYSEPTLTDSTSQSFNLNGAAKTSNWTLQYGESFQSSQDIMAQTATQTKQHSWDTTFSASREFGQRSKYDGTLALNELYGDIFPDSKTWTTSHRLSSQITKKLNAGLGVTLGKIDFDSQDDMHYEQYSASIRWQSTEKIDLSIEGGFENRHFDTPGVGTLRSPTLQASLGYHPFEHTRISVTGIHAVSTSYLSSELVRNDGWSVSLNQRLLEKLNLSMSYNDQSNDYKGYATSNLPTVRKDTYKSFNTSLGVRLLKHWTLSAIYQNTKNTSDNAGFGFATVQYGIELSGGF